MGTPQREGGSLPERITFGIVAAIEREIRPLVEKKDWRKIVREHSGRQFTFFESNIAVVVCGGIGSESARRATEALISLYPVDEIASAGFAGALDSNMRVGEIVHPGKVIDIADGSATVIPGGKGRLLSSASVAGASQKAKLGESYGAQAVDMEAASVARGAEIRGVRFVAIKVISDELDFDMPGLRPFIGNDGQFRTGAFAMYAVIRPRMWSKIGQLARNSAKASAALCKELEKLIADQPSNECALQGTLAAVTSGPATIGQ
jgi:adenosylhomocysteine nucleosidase